MVITKVAALVVAVSLLGVAAAAAAALAPPSPGHAAGTVTWTTTFPRYDLPSDGPFAFDGAFTVGAQVVQGRVNGGVGVLDIPTLTYSFGITSAVPGLLSGRCVAPTSQFIDLGLTGPDIERQALNCSVRAKGGPATTLTMSVVGVMTNVQNSSSLDGPIYTYKGIFAG